MASPWMSISDVMEILSQELPDLVKRHMLRFYGNAWMSQVRRLVDPSANEALLRDPHLSLKVLGRFRDNAFASALHATPAGYSVGSLRTARNLWAHFEPVTSRDAAFVIGQAKVLLSALGSVSMVEIDDAARGEPLHPREPLQQAQPPQPPAPDRELLLARGFQHFESIVDLTANAFANIPRAPGVYAVMRSTRTSPEFLPASPAGHFKGKDPTVPIQWLEDQWVSDADVLYVGQTTRYLSERIRHLIQFGSGRPVGHWGGRLLWQVAGSASFVIGWTESGEPRELESDLLRGFVETHGQLPFANLALGAATPGRARPQPSQQPEGEEEPRPAATSLTLHEAMASVLGRRPGEWMTLAALADEIAAKRLYLRGDGDPPRPSQLRARVGKHPELFEIRTGNPTAVRLRSQVAWVATTKIKGGSD